MLANGGPVDEFTIDGVNPLHFFEQGVPPSQRGFLVCWRVASWFSGLRQDGGIAVLARSTKRRPPWQSDALARL